MPRKTGSSNTSNYHYDLHQLTPSGEFLSSRLFRTQGEIVQFSGFSLSVVNRLITDTSKEVRDKSRNIRIFRIQQPVEPIEQMEFQTLHKSATTE